MLRALSLCTCCRHYPGAAAERSLRSSHPAVSAFDDKRCRVGLHIDLFEDCSAFTRVAARTLAPSPIRDRLSEGFSHFVTSMTAPVASGWSGWPGGACTHWKCAALSRRTRTADVQGLLEASSRLGGRAWTCEIAGQRLDLGCGWLHSGDRNSWTRIAEKAGRVVDRRPPKWGIQYHHLGFSPDEQKAARGAFAEWIERLAVKPPPSDCAADALSKVANGTATSRRSAVSSAARGWKASPPPTTSPMTRPRQTSTCVRPTDMAT